MVGLSSITSKDNGMTLGGDSENGGATDDSARVTKGGVPGNAGGPDEPGTASSDVSSDNEHYWEKGPFNFTNSTPHDTYSLDQLITNTSADYSYGSSTEGQLSVVG